MTQQAEYIINMWRKVIRAGRALEAKSRARTVRLHLRDPTTLI